MAVLPLLALVTTSSLTVIEANRQIADIDEGVDRLSVVELAEPLLAASAVERGLTSRLLVGDRVTAELEAQRALVDAAFAELTQRAESLRLDSDSLLAQAIAAHSQIDETRAAVDARAIRSTAAVTAYTDWHDLFITAVSQSAIQTGQVELARPFAAHASLLRLRDRLGVERAVVSSMIAAQRPSADDGVRLGHARGETAAAIRTFEIDATEGVWQAWQAVHDDPIAVNIDSVVRLLFDTDPNTPSMEASEAFELFTDRIALLEPVIELQSSITGDELAEARDAASDERRNAVVISLVFILAVAVFLTVMVRGLLRDLRDVSRRVVEQAALVGALGVDLETTSTETTNHAEHVTASGHVIAESSTAVAGAVVQLQEAALLISESAAMTSDQATSAEAAARNSIAGVAELESAAEQITSIVALIGNIAEQTNLLALNATIEAARAGEAGRGFSVVAGEVKELAKRTTVATEEISARVEAINRTSHESIDAFGNVATSIAQIAEGQQNVAAAIEEQVVTIASTSSQISAVSDGTVDISLQVEEILGSAREGVTKAHQAAAVAELLHETSIALERIVGR